MWNCSVWPYYTGSCTLFKPCCCTCMREKWKPHLSTINAVIKAEVNRWSSTLLSKPRLSVHHQYCCWSHVVMEQGIWQGKKRRRCQPERIPLSIFQVMFSLPSYSFVVKQTAYHVHTCELTVIDSVFMYGLLIGLGWANMAALCRWPLHGESNVLLI